MLADSGPVHIMDLMALRPPGCKFCSGMDGGVYAVWKDLEGCSVACSDCFERLLGNVRLEPVGGAQ